jgi:leucyl aminopeptidase (aminopeptidase T)
MDATEGARNALTCVLEARRGERLTIICDEALGPVGEAFASAGLGLGLWMRLVVLPAGNAPRKEIPPAAESAVVENTSDIFINILRGGAEETPFRIALTRLEKRRRVRLGHCPGITLDMLTDGALALGEEEYRDLQGRAEELMAVLQGATAVRIQNPDGTDLSFSVEGRAFFTDTKLDWGTLKWMNLPVGEVIVGPVESSAEGALVCTTAVGGLGPVREPVTLEVFGGSVRRIACKDAAVKTAIEKVQSTDDWAKRIGEFAFGLNPRARLVPDFLETEKMGGTVHVAFGNNADYPGGRNTSRTHQDFLMAKATVTVEFGKRKRTITRDGKFVYK